MISKNFTDEHIELKRVATQPEDAQPRYAWADLARLRSLEDTSKVFIRAGEGDRRPFAVSDVADTIGKALTSLLLSRNESEEDIFNEANKSFVAQVSKSVAEELAQAEAAADTEGGHELTEEEIAAITERVLVRHQAYDLAKSHLIHRRYTDADGGLGTDADPALVRVIRRNGEVVTWNPWKIESAVRMAFLELELDPAPSSDISRALTTRLVNEAQEFIHIEDLQDRVQEEIMRLGHFKVAEAYILFRARRAELRRQEEKRRGQVQPPADGDQQDSLVLLQTEDGESSLWDGSDLRKRIEFATIDLELNLSSEEIEQELRRSVFSEISAADLKKTVILNAKSLIERDADFSKFAGRILLTYIYEEVLGWDILKDGISKLPEFHRRAFKKNLARGVDIRRINPALLEYDLDTLAKAIDPAADLDFDYLGIQTLYDRYLIVDKQGDGHRRLECPQLFWMRVSMGLFVGEEKDRTENIIGLYRLYKGRRFCSSTPTLFNSGTQHSQLSSCYLYHIGDSLEAIMQRGIAENAYLSKWAGGLGGSWTAVRGTGSHIHGTNGESQGVIPFLKLHNDQLCAVNQGGKRKGSGCAYIESWHNDVFDFLELRKNTGDDRRRTHDLNTANWIPDLFMKRMESRGDWTLFRSSEVPDLHDLYGKAFETRYEEYEAKAAAGEIVAQTVPALDLWKAMLRMIFETGHPWMTFKDPCNVRSPQDHAGVIHSSNLCTEITLNTGPDETAVCNLGSVVLDNHLTPEGEIDHEKLRETIQMAVRALDNVIDINFYPTEAAKTANSRHRPVGLGIMGLQNSLFHRGASFGSEEAIEFNDEFQEAIAYYAYEASSDLAAERGSYPSYEGSKWSRGLMPQDTVDLLEEERGEKIDVPRGGKMDWEPLRKKIAKQGMRNSNVLAIAPTATISNIMGSSPCIEPTFKNLFVKSNLSGDFIVLNQFLVRDLKALGLWTTDMCAQLKYHDGELGEIDGIPDEIKEKYRTAFGIDFNWFIEAAARRQKWIDQSQSLNLFLAEPDLKTLSHMYRAAWRKGLKTTYYLRTVAASSIEKSTLNVSKDKRGIVGGNGEAAPTPEQVQACSLEAMQNGEECEMCQ